MVLPSKCFLSLFSPGGVNELELSLVCPGPKAAQLRNLLQGSRKDFKTLDEFILGLAPPVLLCVSSLLEGLFLFARLLSSSLLLTCSTAAGSSFAAVMAKKKTDLSEDEISLRYWSELAVFGFWPYLMLRTSQKHGHWRLRVEVQSSCRCYLPVLMSSQTPVIAQALKLVVPMMTHRHGKYTTLLLQHLHTLEEGDLSGDNLQFRLWFVRFFPFCVDCDNALDISPQTGGALRWLSEGGPRVPLSGRVPRAQHQSHAGQVSQGPHASPQPCRTPPVGQQHH